MTSCGVNILPFDKNYFFVKRWTSIINLHQILPINRKSTYQLPLYECFWHRRLGNKNRPYGLNSLFFNTTIHGQGGYFIWFMQNKKIDFFLNLKKIKRVQAPQFWNRLIGTNFLEVEEEEIFELQRVRGYFHGPNTHLHNFKFQVWSVL